MNTIAYIGLAGLIGLLVNVGISAVAFAQPSSVDLSNDLEIVDAAVQSKTWIFIADPRCTSDDMVKLHDDVMNNRYQYGAYVDALPFEVVCFPHGDFETMDTYMPAMRALFPVDMFIFVYDLAPDKIQSGYANATYTSSTPTGMVASQIVVPTYKEAYRNRDHWFWQMWLRSNGISNEDDIKNIYGKAFVEAGFAIADKSPEVINHEWTHLATCSVHGYGANDRNPQTWARIEGSYPWCTGLI